jgi:hypothetical protein
MQIPKENVRYVDRPEVSETFIDSFHFATFDGTTFRIELCVTRMDEPKPPKPPTARKYPVCRLVMPPQATVELFNQLQTFINIMEQKGLVKGGDPQPPGEKKKH